MLSKQPKSKKEMVRKSNTISLGDAIKEFLDQYKHSGKIREAEIANAWPAVMGHNIAKLTLNVFYKRGKLIVQLKTPALRQELMMHRSAITKALNKHLGASCIKELVLR